MLVKVEAVLSKDEVRAIRRVLEATPWVDGRVTAGVQSALAKNNLQVPEDAPQARELGETILRALGRSGRFYSAALPLKVFPPLFNRYDEGMAFGAHVDNAIRYVTGASGRIRTDVSCTLFLSEPDEYDGGDLVIQDTYGAQQVKFAAGDVVVYPSTSLHRVEPVTRGARWASFFWLQSMVREGEKRRLLFDMDESIQALAAAHGQDHPQVVSLTGLYHNLVRMWAEM